MLDLVKQLVSQLGVTETQAKGGAGLLLKIAQSRLGTDFGQVTAAMPWVSDLISAAPQAGGAAKLAGGLLGAIGGDKASGAAGLASLASGFSQLNLDAGTAAKFASVILDVAKNQAGPAIQNLLANTMQA
jgi:hypothetical protein